MIFTLLSLCQKWYRFSIVVLALLLFLTKSMECFVQFIRTMLIIVASLFFTDLVCVSSWFCLDKSLVSPIFWAKTWTIHFIDCFFVPSTFGWGREMMYYFLVDGVSSPILKSSSFSWARTPICAVSMSVDMHISLNSFYAMWLTQFREIMKHSTTFIVIPPPLIYLYQLYPIVHYPVIHILRREEHKLLFMHRYSKFLLLIRLCIFLMCTMVMSEGRKVCHYYVSVCKVGLFTADGCQKGVMNNTLLLVIVSYSINNSPI